MPDVRSGPAVAAYNGKVYIIGGFIAGFVPQSQVREYDPVANTYTTKASAPATGGNMAGAEYNGEIFVFGGSVAVSQAYNPTTDTWRTLAPFPRADCQSNSIFVLDGELWVVGCLSQPIAQQVHVYNPVSNTWRIGTLYSSDHAGPGAATFLGRGYVIGGGAASGGSTVVESLGGGSCPTPGTPAPTSTPPISTPTATVCVPGGGGVPGPWATSTTGPSTRYRNTGTQDGTYVYVMGGGTSTGTYLNDLWRWTPATQTWTQLANMPTAKQNAQAAYWNGKIYLPGGFVGSHLTENAIYDIATNTWSTGAPLPAARSGMTAAYNNKIYVVGGNPVPFNNIVVYDIALNSWSTAAATLPVGLAYGRAITVGNYIYIIGGIAATQTVGTVYRYDPVADTIATMTPLQQPRTWEELMTDGSRIFAVAGGGPGTAYFNGVPLANTVEIYDIALNTWTYGNPVVTTASSVGGGTAGAS